MGWLLIGCVSLAAIVAATSCEVILFGMGGNLK